eukprot:363022-Chlamydomonas_euryale.AAC.5
MVRIGGLAIVLATNKGCKGPRAWASPSHVWRPAQAEEFSGERRPVAPAVRPAFAACLAGWDTCNRPKVFGDDWKCGMRQQARSDGRSVQGSKLDPEPSRCSHGGQHAATALKPAPSWV